MNNITFQNVVPLNNVNSVSFLAEEHLDSGDSYTMNIF